MQYINSHIKINKLLNYSKKITLKKSYLPKIIIIFDESFFNKKVFFKLKIPEKSAFLFRSYKIKERKKIAKQLLKFCKIRKLKLIIASDIKLAEEINADGVHFSEYMIKKKTINWKEIKNLRLKKNWIITTSAHSKRILNKMKNYEIDAVLLSPIFSTKSHPNKKSLGLNKFLSMIKDFELPVYALGGINIKNVKFLDETDIIGYAFQRGI
tara:strand:- start:8281 stop:8913 length:633 start_codon:yes stop_codon:yes gene_type:complete